MAAGNRICRGRLSAVLLTGLAALGVLAPIGEPALAQSTANPFSPKVADDAKLQLTSSQLIYDRDTQKVIAVGGVQINYGGYKLVAKRVEPVGTAE